MAIDIIKDIEKSVRGAIEEYENREDVETGFGEPIIAYMNSDDVLFDTFFARGGFDHPKRIYRPSYTVILHYVPFAENPYEAGDEALQKRCFDDGTKLAMSINRAIRGSLNKIGRLTSYASSMSDWNMKKNQHEWSNKLAAFVAGIGELGPAGSLHIDDTKPCYYGTASVMLVDAKYAPPKVERTEAELEQIWQQILSDCCFKGAQNVHCSEEMIAACPAGAIEEDGIDREKCQEYCLKINSYIPAPENCGQCFRFKEK